MAFFMPNWRLLWVLETYAEFWHEIQSRNFFFKSILSHPSIVYHFLDTKQRLYFRLMSFRRFSSHFPPLSRWNQFLNQKALSWGDDFRWFQLGTNFFPRSSKFSLISLNYIRISALNLYFKIIILNLMQRPNNKFLVLL